jgi:hypothetical protein
MYLYNMVEKDKINYLNLESWVQDQIARELVSDFDAGYNPNDYKDLVVSLFEYDPNLESDREILEYWLSDKLRNEGVPAEADLSFYRENVELLIKMPILIIQGTCSEGRHRLSVALQLNEKIMAYIC